MASQPMWPREGSLVVGPWSRRRARTVGSGKLIGDFAGELRGGEVDLAHFVAEFELA